MANTPMMQQYNAIKKKHEDSILFFRLGDFYEMFYQDATTASSVLGLTLTGRGKDDQRVPMCGIPFHAAEGYVSKLVKQGYKVAICEQVEAADATKGPTKRDVVRIVTPGTAQLSPVLDATESNYLAAVCKVKAQYGLAVVDVSTGAFLCNVFESFHDVTADIHRLGVMECLVDDALAAHQLCQTQSTFFPYDVNQAQSAICNHFNVQSLQAFNIQDLTASFPAIVAIIDYLNYTQKGAFAQIKTIQSARQHDYCRFDAGVIDHLGLFDAKTGLFKLINHTTTSMGARQLRQFLRYPLINPADIAHRHAQIETLHNHHTSPEWSELTHQINDIERVLGRICSKFQNPKDALALAQSLGNVTDVLQYLQSLGPAFEPQVQALSAISDELIKLHDHLGAALLDDVPTHIRDGGIFNATHSAELSSLLESFASVRTWINELEPKLKQQLDIKSLKVGFNKVFGYYIEVPNAQQDKVPEEYIRKQTLTNAERYITNELKEKEAIILNAQSQQAELEKQLYAELESTIESFIQPLQLYAQVIAHVDAMASLAHVAQTQGFSKPIIHPATNRSLVMNGLWHPMVAVNQKQPFIRNSIALPENQPFMLITGPNMAGKSTIMRSVAISAILGQMGSYVPATMAEFGVVTEVYTRIGANDKLAEGQSTFMVEMIETATITQNATSNSLILLDEIGRGTSTFDGVSIAAAVAEYIVTHIKARTLFATHYHELTALSDKYPQIQNTSMQIKELENQLVFAYTLAAGPAEKSYGVMVAKMAGLPKEITDKADAWLDRFEQKAAQGEIVQLQLF